MAKDPRTPNSSGILSKEHADWRNEIMPGCFFVRYLEEQDLVLYGQVLPFIQPCDGCVPTLCHSSKTYPQQVMTPLKSMSMMLSVEQFTLARERNWPSTQNGLSQVFDLASN